MNPNKVIFVDTNAFIQLRDLADLPWKELFPGAEMIAIMAARPVVEELDRFKTSTKSRIRDRSRRALKLIDQAAKAEDKTIVLRDKPVRVTLTVASRKRPDWGQYPDLDPSSADDRLVVAAADFGPGTELLSHDSGPRLSAGDIGLPAHAPPASWLLPPQQTDDQRKITQLQRQLQEAMDGKPKVEIRFPSAEDGIIRYVCPILEPLNGALQARLVQVVLQENPRENLRSLGNMAALMQDPFNRISDRQINNYNHDYDEYRLSVESYFSTLHEKVAKVASLPRVAYEVVNAGQVSVVRLVIGIRSADFGLLGDDSEIDAAVGSTNLPTPPDRPAGQQDYLGRSLSGFSPILTAQGPRDPTAMLWHDRPRFGDKVGSYGCDDFGPGRVYCDEIGLWPTATDQSTGDFLISVSGNDMAKLNSGVRIILEQQKRDWLHEAIMCHFPELVREQILQEAG